ncbi:lysophospholipid acyltransferase family protein [Chitinispirillales bacterium ANBcel5]|uniref:lysophospholipid acyltransferase family protein n=1 Tax=Cellulosispirillum alkaliphilum TaxID=3039283 RepID=UPI002A539C5E|nr:lysophospholipid acyltransferase family protein [Chitinispirillales bacterium ANBcel5]
MLFSQVSFAENLLGSGKLFLLKTLYACSIFPLRVRYCITDVLSAIAFIVCTDKCRAVAYNLSLILERKPCKSEIYRVFKEYGRYWAELPDMVHFTKSIPKYYAGDQFPPKEPNFLGLTFHMGNFEVFGHLLYSTNKSEFNVVAERLRPQSLADFFTQQRSKYYLKTISHDNPRAVLKTLKQGGALGILCDRQISGKGTEVSLFGKKVSMPLNLVNYALQSKIPIYIAYCVKENGGIKIASKRIDETSSFENAKEVITSTLESAARKYPYQWHVLSPIC